MGYRRLTKGVFMRLFILGVAALVTIAALEAKAQIRLFPQDRTITVNNGAVQVDQRRGRGFFGFGLIGPERTRIRVNNNNNNFLVAQRAVFHQQQAIVANVHANFHAQAVQRIRVQQVHAVQQAVVAQPVVAHAVVSQAVVAQPVIAQPVVVTPVVRQYVVQQAVEAQPECPPCVPNQETQYQQVPQPIILRQSATRVYFSTCQ
jgi:hypothetical protein